MYNMHGIIMYYPCKYVNIRNGRPRVSPLSLASQGTDPGCFLDNAPAPDGPPAFCYHRGYRKIWLRIIKMPLKVKDIKRPHKTGWPLQVETLHSNIFQLFWSSWGILQPCPMFVHPGCPTSRFRWNSAHTSKQRTHFSWHFRSQRGFGSFWMVLGFWTLHFLVRLSQIWN